jgi:hypothetical protein
MTDPIYTYVRGQGWVIAKPEPRKFDSTLDLRLLCNTCNKPLGTHSFQGHCLKGRAGQRWS